jgi:hypothetical protein
LLYFLCLSPFLFHSLLFKTAVWFNHNFVSWFSALYGQHLRHLCYECYTFNKHWMAVSIFSVLILIYLQQEMHKLHGDNFNNFSKPIHHLRKPSILQRRSLVLNCCTQDEPVVSHFT